MALCDSSYELFFMELLSSKRSHFCQWFSVEREQKVADDNDQGPLILPDETAVSLVCD